MNKTVICFLFLILFFQYKCSDCTGKTGEKFSDEVCNALSASNNKYCVPHETEGCIEISCQDKISGATEDFCSKLHST